MNREHPNKKTKCKLLAFGGSILIGTLFFMSFSDFYNSYQNGNIKFRYHSNLFYGTEALVMYLAVLMGFIVGGLSLYFYIQKCLNKK